MTTIEKSIVILSDSLSLLAELCKTLDEKILQLEKEIENINTRL